LAERVLRDKVTGSREGLRLGWWLRIFAELSHSLFSGQYPRNSQSKRRFMAKGAITGFCPAGFGVAESAKLATWRRIVPPEAQEMDDTRESAPDGCEGMGLRRPKREETP